MAIKDTPSNVHEIIGSGASTQTPRAGEFQKKYRITGTRNEADVRTEVLNTAPSEVEGLPLGQVVVTAVDWKVWEATLTYTYRELERVDSTWSFNAAGANTHINHSLGTVRAYALKSGRAAPNFFGAINVTKDDVQGLDVMVPQMTFSETHKYDPATVNTGFLKKIHDYTGHVNTGMFRNFASGEVLFTGASGSYNDTLVTVTFNFQVGKNIDLNVAGTTVSKGAFQYMWVYYEEAEDASSETIVKEPVAAYVERIYPNVQFSLLGLPSFPGQGEGRITNPGWM